MASLAILKNNTNNVQIVKLNTINNYNVNNRMDIMNLTDRKHLQIMNSKTFNKLTVENTKPLLTSNNNINNNNNNNNSNHNNNNSNSNNNNNNNNDDHDRQHPNIIVHKIKDFGMIGSVNNASGSMCLNTTLNKKHLLNTKNYHIIKENKANSYSASLQAARRQRLSKEERIALRAAKKSAKENSIYQASVGSRPAGTPGRKALPLPQAVARRNARERNRVKQVNNGFAALRERIPSELAEAYDVPGNNRNANKKLSKVETLRMAVEYIRGLERLLGFEFPVENDVNRSSSSGEESFNLIKEEFSALSPTLEEHYDDNLSQYESDDYFTTNNMNSIQHLQQQQEQQEDHSLMHTDEANEVLPNITTLNGLQYIRIPGTNTFQLLTPDLFIGSANSPPSSSIDDEQFNHLTNDINCNPIQSNTTHLLVRAPEHLHYSPTAAERQPIAAVTAEATLATTVATSLAQAKVLSTSAAPAETALANAECVIGGTCPVTEVKQAIRATKLNLLITPVPSIQTLLSATSSTSSTSTSTSSLSLPSSSATALPSSLALGSALATPCSTNTGSSSLLPQQTSAVLSLKPAATPTTPTTTTETTTTTVIKSSATEAKFTALTTRTLTELPPASVEDYNNLSQKCAGDQHYHTQQYQQQQQQQQLEQQQRCLELLQQNSKLRIQFIKQQYHQGVVPTQTIQNPNSNINHPSTTVIHLQQQRQQQQQMLVNQKGISPSPPLEALPSLRISMLNPKTTTNTNSNNIKTASLQQHLPTNFYMKQNENDTYFDGSSTSNLKKEFDEVLLNEGTNNVALSDESMIETIDWWDDHTPKSEASPILI